MSGRKRIGAILIQISLCVCLYLYLSECGVCVFVCSFVFEMSFVMSNRN